MVVIDLELHEVLLLLAQGLIHCLPVIFVYYYLRPLLDLVYLLLLLHRHLLQPLYFAHQLILLLLEESDSLNETINFLYQ